MESRSHSPRLGPNPWLASAVIFALALACYWPALHGGLVWDDAAHVTRPELQSWAGLGRIWTDLHATQQFYPVLHSVFWFEHRLWGDATLGYHLSNVVFHATAACLFALVLLRLWQIPPAAQSGASDPMRASPRCISDSSLAAWLAAALFVVHPVGVESVAWISEQKNTLSLVFYLAAGLVYLNFNASRRGRSYAWATTCFVLALGTKSVTATLPAALLVVLWWKRGDVQWRRDVVPLLPWFVAAALAGFSTAWIERTLIGASGGTFDLSVTDRVLLAARNVWFYLGKLAWPADLMFVYPRWDVAGSATRWYGWLVGAVAVTLVLWLLRRRARGPLTCWLIFVGSLFPALGFFNVYPFLFSYVADHFQYLASLGMFALASRAATTGLARWPLPAKVVGGIAGMVVVSGLAVLANQQSRNYRNSETLYRETLARNPECWMAHTNLAAELARLPGHETEVIAHYREALRLKPDNAEAHNNLGNTLATIPGRESEAIAHFEAALKIDPGFIEPHLNLANLIAEKMPGKIDEALRHCTTVVRLKPDYSEGHFCLANTLALMPGRTAEALAEYAVVLRLRPDHSEAHANLAALLANIPGRFAEAAAHYEEAARLAPGVAKTRYNYALLLENEPGREEEAIAQYTAALRVDPTYAEPHNNLAILLAQRGEYDAARAHWETALKLKPNYEDARKNLELLNRRKPR